MKINIQSIGLTPRQELLDLIHEKIGKLTRFNDQIMEANVTLKAEKAERRDNKIIEVRLAVPGDDLFVKKQGETFEEILQKSTDALQREATDWKKRKQA